MKDIIHILADFYCDFPDMEAVKLFAEKLVVDDCDCPPETYELLNPGGAYTLHNIEVVAEYLNHPEYLNCREFEIAVADLVLEKLKRVLRGDLSHETVHKLIVFLSNNFEASRDCLWLGNLYNDFDMFGEWWDDVSKIDQILPIRIVEIETWKNV